MSDNIKDIEYKLIDNDEPTSIPEEATVDSAGYDLCAIEDVNLQPFQPTLVKTNLSIAIPKNTCLLILPRSGNALKRNIMVLNSPGLIDADYRGEVGVILMFANPVSMRPIRKGDKIAQALLIPYYNQNWVPVTELSETERGTGGFGSTGN